MVFSYIWPLAGPNIAEKGAAPLVEKALGRVLDGFETGLGIREFWKCRFLAPEGARNQHFWRLKAPGPFKP